MPLVSVVVTFYNQPHEFLRESLGSLLVQTLPLWEAIVVDDGSTHADAHAVVSGLDPRVRLIRHTRNRGLGAARNTGILVARAPLVALLDADDRLSPDFLAATVRALEDHPDASWVAVDWKAFGARDDETWSFPPQASMNCPAHFLFAGAGILMRKSVWKMIGGYPEEAALRCGEDWDFWIAVAERGLRRTYVARPLYLYRMHPAGMSSTSAPYNEHVFRHGIYRRHQRAFETLGLDCPKCPSAKTRITAFLAQGFLVSSCASLRRGDRLRAIRLAIRACMLQPWDPVNLRQLARSLVPSQIRGIVQRMTRAQAIRRNPGSP